MEQVVNILETIKPGQKLQSELQARGIKSHADAGIVFLDHEQRSTEPTVRVYRGVNNISADNILNQVAYAARAVEAGEVKILPELESHVDAVAHHPNFQNLLELVEAGRPYLSQDGVEEWEKNLETVEDDVLNGMTVRRSLDSQKVNHGGGYPDHGLSPYVSVSWSSQEARGYGRKTHAGGMLVIDCPVSEIEAYTDGTEIGLKAGIKLKNITAVLDYESIHSDENLRRSLAQLDKETHTVDTQKDQDLARRFSRNEHQIDLQKITIDQALVRQKRTDELLAWAVGTTITREQCSQYAQDHQTDSYTAISQLLFDYFDTRLKFLKGGNTSFTKVESRFPNRKGYQEEFNRDRMKKEGVGYLAKWYLYQEKRLLPDLIEQFHLPDSATSEDCLDAREKLFDEAETRGLKVDRGDYSRLQIRALQSKLSVGT